MNEQSSAGVTSATQPANVLEKPHPSELLKFARYDTALITAFFAFPVFRCSYGAKISATSGYQISPPWQSGLVGAALSGEVLGLACNGFLTDRFGYRKTLLAALLWLAVFIFLAFFAFSIEMLLVS